MNTHSDKRTYVPFVIALIAALGMGGLLGYIEWYISVERAMLATRAAEIEASYATYRAKEDERAVLEETKKERAMLEQALLKTDTDVLTFLDEIETLGRAVGLNVTTKKLTEAAEEDTQYGSVTVELLGDGSLDATQTFITHLEALPYHSALTAVSLKRNTGDDVSVETVTAEITLSVIAYGL